MVNRLSDDINEFVKRSILITGSARSGTTILGKLVGTLKNVEYFFEPPLLFSVYANYKASNQQIADNTVATYLFEDLLLQRLMARNVNINKNDDSSIFHQLSSEEVERRSRLNLRKYELVDLAYQKKIAYKIPDIVPLLDDIEFLKDHSILRCRRDISEQVNSLYNRKWFAEENLSDSQIWPNKYFGEKKFPFWLNKEFYQIWYDCKEVDRCFIYSAHMEVRLNADNILNVNYSEFINNKHDLVDRICRFLSLEPSILTSEVVNSIKVQPTTKKMNLNKVSKDVIKLCNERLKAPFDC